MGRTLLVAVVVVALLVAALWAFQRRLVYLPSGSDVPAAAAVLEEARDVPLRTEDGLELTAWFVPAREPARDVAVLVAPGNAGNRAGRVALAEGLTAEGFSVLLLEYRGYGGNPGSPSEDGLALDVRAARQHLLEAEGLPPDRILYFGESLGAAVVSELAVEHPPAGLVLRSPFESLAAMAAEHYRVVPAFLLRDELAVVDHVRQVEVPTTVVYGSHDTVVPPRQSRAVAEAAPRLLAEIEVPGADHNDAVLLDGDQVVRAVVEMAEKVIP